MQTVQSVNWEKGTTSKLGTVFCSVDKTEDLSLGHSPSESSEGLLRRAKVGGARIYRDFCNSKHQKIAVNWGKPDITLLFLWEDARVWLTEIIPWTSTSAAWSQLPVEFSHPESSQGPPWGRLQRLLVQWRGSCFHPKLPHIWVAVMWWLDDLQHPLFYWYTSDICFIDTYPLGFSLGRRTNSGGFPRSRAEKPWAPRGRQVTAGLALRISSAPNLWGPSLQAQWSPRGQHCRESSL